MVYCKQDFGKENTMIVSLPPDVENYLQEQIAAGFYPSVSEAIIEAVRLLQERDQFEEKRLEILRARLAKAEADFERGDYIDIDSKEELVAFMDKIKSEGRKRLAEKQKVKSA